MNSQASWSVEGIDPQVRERAEAAARRAGVSLADWLEAAIPSHAPLRANVPLPAQDAKDVVDIHHRLDAITRQIENMSRPAPRDEIGVASQLNDAISRLDARLSQINEPATKAAPATRSMAASPSLRPISLEDAIAELSARQSELSVDTRQAPSPSVATPSKQGASADISGVEKQLHTISGQLGALQRPDAAIEKSIASFRSELAEIRQTITEAMPRRAIESIENDIRSLSNKIDEQRKTGIDGQALAGVERALSEIKDVLLSLTPAEKLADFDDAISNLGGKIDVIVRANGEDGTVQELEGAIFALREIVSNVASNEALGRLSDDVRLLGTKVDQFSRPHTFNDGFAALEKSIAQLNVTLENRQTSVSSQSEHLEGALRALSDRLDHLPVGTDSTSAFAHLEQRVSYLLERVEMSTDYRSNNFGAVEAGLQDILRYMEKQSASLAAIPTHGFDLAMDPELVDTIKRELSEIRFGQTMTDRQTQDSLEVVHNTLGHVVDRLSIIEGDLRASRSTPATSMPVMAPTPRPELPNPVAVQPSPESRPATQDYSEAAAAAAVAAPRAISDILDQQPAPVVRAVQPGDEINTSFQRATFHPELPPDHPLEPGTLPQSRVALPTERLADLDSASNEPASTSSFIAAARRAAQAAAAAAPNDKNARNAGPVATDKAAAPSTITTKIRSLLVGASVVVIVLGSFKMAMSLFDGSTTESAPMTLAPPDGSSRPSVQTPVAPSMTSPTSIGRQSLIAPPVGEMPFAGMLTSMPAPSIPPAQAQTAAAQTQVASADVTGSIPTQTGKGALPPIGRKPTQISIPATEKLPETIGGPLLRAAALKGDPTAAYEIGMRYAEARGVVLNYDEAAKWYDRAAQAGVVPAMFRLGTLYEKGLSVKKDLEMARIYYTAAADRGNAKAMHNLAVLDADASGNGANYKSAAQWFRKAADRGIADSQYNLGILYARGIGVEQNLAESFKWFSLAAAQGDADSATKRDDVTKRLDPQSLAAAKLAIQTFTPEPQPEDATTVASPAGGWDAVATAAAVAKPAAKRAAR